jgi:hypothetical protein
LHPERLSNNIAPAQEKIKIQTQKVSTEHVPLSYDVKAYKPLNKMKHHKSETIYVYLLLYYNIFIFHERQPKRKSIVDKHALHI